MCIRDRELEEHRDKLQEYDNRLDTLQDRNSYSKTDKDATFMRMKGVSYTHLDVYKRQIPDGALRISCKQLNENAVNDGINTSKEKDIRTLLYFLTVKAVSYTHLFLWSKAIQQS